MKIKLLSHEKKLLDEKQLLDITHTNSSSIWLHSDSVTNLSDGMIAVYRVMGDIELMHLLNHGILPDTQPYQAIVKDEEGRLYMEKYLKGKKKVNTSPTTVIEFVIPKKLWDQLFDVQHKNEDGVLSIGLGDKAGKGLGIFNESLEKKDSSYRIVTVKRN